MPSGFGENFFINHGQVPAGGGREPKIGSVNLGGYLLTIGLGAIGVYCIFAAAFPELPVTKVAYWKLPRNLIARGRLVVGGAIALGIVFFVWQGS